MVISLEQGANYLHLVQLIATATPSSLLHQIENGYPFGTGLPTLSWRKGR